MTAELFFIYDSHCPWSYAATPLVNEIANTFPDININLWHNAHFDGEHPVTQKQLDSVMQICPIAVSPAYLANLAKHKDATLAANVLSWASHKAPDAALALLNAMQKAHFEQGNELLTSTDIQDILQQFKLSPPAKAFTLAKLTKDAEADIHEIFAMQDFIGTEAIPALLLAVDDNLILLNHNLYLNEPRAIIDAVRNELG